MQQSSESNEPGRERAASIKMLKPPVPSLFSTLFVFISNSTQKFSSARSEKKKNKIVGFFAVLFSSALHAFSEFFAPLKMHSGFAHNFFDVLISLCTCSLLFLGLTRHNIMMSTIMIMTLKYSDRMMRNCI